MVYFYNTLLVIVTVICSDFLQQALSNSTAPAFSMMDKS